MAQKTIRIGCLLVVLLVSSCYYDVEEEIYGQTGCNTIDVSFASDVQPLIVSNCYPCHTEKSRFGNIVLEGYDAVKVQAENGKLAGVINHAPGFSAMPQSAPKLLDCQIEKIESWILDGALNN